jgi:hypothetical protein
MSIDLRFALQKITDESNVKLHPTAISELDNHSIESLESAYPIENYTCVMDALQLVGNRQYEEIARCAYDNVFAGRKFITFLLSNFSLKELDCSEAGPNDLIIYFQGGNFQHIGNLVNSFKVRSKWGSGGLYLHGIWEVPSSYGSEVKYFKAQNSNQYFELFIKYAEFCGLTFE